MLVLISNLLSLTRSNSFNCRFMICHIINSTANLYFYLSYSNKLMHFYKSIYLFELFIEIFPNLSIVSSDLGKSSLVNLEISVAASLL